MSFRILLSSQAERDLTKLERPVLLKIDRALLLLEEEPYLAGFKHLKDKRLAQFRVRVRDYRILYDVYPKKKIIYVLRIGRRKDIYR